MTLYRIEKGEPTVTMEAYIYIYNKLEACMEALLWKKIKALKK
jgi:hypothetical protein